MSAVSTRSRGVSTVSRSRLPIPSRTSTGASRSSKAFSPSTGRPFSSAPAGMKRIGIDIGGTFTDVVIYDEATHALERRKALSTPQAPEEGCLAAFRDAGLSSNEISHLIHG